jgi:hypothetical protein
LDQVQVDQVLLGPKLRVSHSTTHILVDLRGGGGPCECAEAADAVDVIDAGGLDDVGD